MKVFRKMAMIILSAAMCFQMGAAYIRAEAAVSTKEMTRNIAEGFNGAFNLYKNGTYDGTESMLLLDGEMAWCVEPATSVGAGWTAFTSVSVTGQKWLGNRYGWSEEKVGNLSKAIYFAKSYFGDKASDYVLVQNLIWSGITAAEDSSQSGRYVLTSNSKAYRNQLDTKAKLDAAMNAVWAKVNDYNKQPSWNGKTVTGDIGEVVYINDTNAVSDDLAFTNIPSGIAVSRTAGGISIKADNSYAGKTVTLNYYKSQIPQNAFGSNPVTIYEHTGRQSISMWEMAMNPATGRITVTFPYGQGGVGKKDSQTGNIVAGATYYVYKDKSCTQYAADIYGSHTMVTAATYPYVEKLLTYKAGVYYVKEAISPPGYALNEDVLTLTIEAGKISWATVSGESEGWSYDIPIGNAYIKKVSSTNSDTVVGGAEYTVYTDETCTVPAKDINGDDAVFITAVDGDGSNLLTFECGTYYVKETRAAEHYTLDTEHVYVLNIEMGKTVTVDEGTVSDPPKAKAKLKKVSDHADMTADNACYSLAGAVYGIYSDAACDDLLEEIETNTDGETDFIELDAGKYYMKEITASPGYQLSDEIKEIILNPDEEKTFTMNEPPVSDVFSLNIRKGDSDTEEFHAQGIASLEGAVFEVAYFDNIKGDVSDTAVRKWYFRTDENGELFCENPDYLIASHTMKDGTVYISDDLYYDGKGSMVYPLGTYRVKEVSAPKYYQLSGTMCFAEDPYHAVSVTEGLTAILSEENDAAVISMGNGKKITGTNIAVEAYDEIYRGSITVQKYDEDGTTPLQGVKFKLAGSETGEVFTGTTDADGRIIFHELIPQHYILTEISAAAGKNLMKDDIDIAVPIEMSYEEINASGADVKKAVWDEAAQTYCFYESTYKVTNQAVFDMPMAGGNTKILYAGMAAAFGFLCVGVFLAFKRRQKRI